MYSTNLQRYIAEISAYAGVSPEEVSLLSQITGAFIKIFAEAIDAEIEPPSSLFEVSLQLSLLSDALAKSELSDELDNFHYLVGMGFEQTGTLLARFNIGDLGLNDVLVPPLENDDWYRLLLAFLHYLAGGHRVQALSTLRALEQIEEKSKGSEHGPLYKSSLEALKLFYSGRKPSGERLTYWMRLLFGPLDKELDYQENRIRLLAQQVQQRREVILGDLGQFDEGQWLARRNIFGREAEVFWSGYLLQMGRRGITTFTREQVGPGFDEWLQLERDLLVILPTGSGKTIVGELRSALALAKGKQVLWILPTRALVRQTQRELSHAFGGLGVSVEELPVTEDFNPLFVEEDFSQQRYVAATTPEKLLALLRANPRAVLNIGLIVFDEAQILLDAGRCATAEFVLLKLKQLVPNCRMVFMTAFADTQRVLENLLERLGDDVARLVSEIRPTRRIYGVLTDEFSPQRHPVMMLYPPGPQTENEHTETPIRLHFRNVTLPKKASQIAMAKKIVQLTHSVGVRTVLFVQQKRWTESNARDIARKTGIEVQLPEGDLARLRVELERLSSIQEYGIHGVSPHHAGLSVLEQHLVERWMQDGIVRSVVATPTLAQGINLPFDLSIVSFRKRYNTLLQKQEELSNTEILNMLGRAGRAGYVSDGLCLLTDFSDRRSAQQTLDESRRYFFRPVCQSSKRLGLSLLLSLVDESVSYPDWLKELNGVTFHEAQELVSFVLDATVDVGNDFISAILDKIQKFPSASQMVDDQVVYIANMLGGLVVNIRNYVKDPQLIEALAKTGIPLEVLEFYLEEVRGEGYAQSQEQGTLIPWADRVILQSLRSCQARNWYQGLMENIELDAMFSSIALWRNGVPLSQIERVWPLAGNIDDTRITIGEFFNHRISVFAQFWGAIAVCEALVYGDSPGLLDNSMLQKLPAYTREGVSTDLEHDWLRVIGGMDRVLAHKLAEIVVPRIEGHERRRYLRSRLREWKSTPQNLLVQDDTVRQAILSVVGEVIRD